ncbi:DNA methyltransferase [Clostridium sp.]|uniref:DNA methyltransferase n=1 Tax=Clostridium sp. TaxID=1506 RepID=UPI0039F5DA45
MIKINYKDLDEFLNQDRKITNRFNFENFTLSDKERLSDPIFKSIGYPSKIFYKNIQPFINAYTEEGGIVIDSCCGSGSTGIAALLENRKCILIDNSPHAVNIAYNIINYVDMNKLEKTYKKMLSELEDEINGIYYTRTREGFSGYADIIIASNVYSCPSCDNEIILYKNETGKRSEYKCPHCGYVINISKKEIKDRQLDKRRPVEVTIKVTDKNAPIKKEVREVTEKDVELWEVKLNEYNKKYEHYWSPEEKIIYNRCYPRVGGWPGFAIDASVSDLFPAKNLMALKIINNYIENRIDDESIKSFMKFIFLESLFRTSSRLFVSSGIKNVYHIPPVGKEQNVLTVFKRKYRDITKAKKYLQNIVDEERINNNIRIIKGDAQNIDIPSNSVDYAFVDPPYGGMVPYAELNLFYSAWLNEKEDLENEIIIPMDFEKKDGYVEIWGKYIENAFGEIYRVLRPGAYFTVVFHSKFNNIWNELKDIMINRLGFEFVNIIENERGTTFHTNHINDTNPVSAFITYRKPENECIVTKENILVESQEVFKFFDKNILKEGRTYREIQSKIIFLCHEHSISIPSDKEIKQWLERICDRKDGYYFLKSSF